MSSRVMRNSKLKEIVSLASGQLDGAQQLSSPPATPAPAKGKAATRTKAAAKVAEGKTIADAVLKTPLSVVKAPTTAKKTTKKQTPKAKAQDDSPVRANTGTKRKRADAAVVAEEDGDMLPHNMGKRPLAKPKLEEDESEEAPASSKKRKSARQEVKEEKIEDVKELNKGAEDANDDGESPKKRAKKAHPYGLMPGKSPFPDWAHPTAEEAQTVHDLLIASFPKENHHWFIQPDTIPPPSKQVAGCGEVPTILDALIRTLLSAATASLNSSNAFQGLIKRFGLETEGTGKGSVNWNKIHEASLENVFEAIKVGGLADMKSKNIKKILALVHADNKDRRTALDKAKEVGEQLTVEQEAEYAMLQHNTLTLDYYHVLSTEQALDTFSTYPGIGVKTAACVALFCMQRPCFAVDTHVFRLCQYLGWVPPDESRGPKQKKADRNTTFSHCEVIIPDHLKYGLHQLFLEHGKHCPRCRAVTGEKSAGWEDANCPIEHLVKRLGKKKGGTDTPKKTPKKGKRADSDDEEVTPNADEEVDASPTKTGKRKAIAATPSKAGNATPKGKVTPKKASTPAKGPKGAKAATVVKTPKTKPAKKVTKTNDSDEIESCLPSEMSGEEDLEMSDLTDAVEPEED